MDQERGGYTEQVRNYFTNAVSASVIEIWNALMKFSYIAPSTRTSFPICKMFPNRRIKWTGTI